MSEVLDKVREKYPEHYKDVPDDELALRIGTKYPAYLENPDFKTEYQQAVGTRAVTMAQSGVTTLINVLGNPAAGEASKAGRDTAKEERDAATPRLQAAYESVALPP